MVKINILGYPKLKYSSLAFGTLFSQFDLLENPTEDDIKDMTSGDEVKVYEGAIVKDCEKNFFEIDKITIVDNDIVVDLDPVNFRENEED